MVSQCRGGPAGFGVGLLTLAVRLSYPHPSPDPPWAWQNGSPDKHSALWAAFYRRQGQELRPMNLSPPGVGGVGGRGEEVGNGRRDVGGIDHPSLQCSVSGRIYNCMLTALPAK